MAGHNKWAQIKHQKAVTDKKKSAVFSKILNAIAIAAREEPNPDFNPRLRSLMEKARENSIPQENIEKAIKKTKGAENLKEITIEAYGPASIALIIFAITDNSNRTINEIKQILINNDAKMAEAGSVRWAFEGEKPKFPQQLTGEEKQRMGKLIQELENHPDIQKVIGNWLN